VALPLDQLEAGVQQVVRLEPPLGAAALEELQDPLANYIVLSMNRCTIQMTSASGLSRSSEDHALAGKDVERSG
jgi:hypothetical protein